MEGPEFFFVKTRRSFSYMEKGSSICLSGGNGSQGKEDKKDPSLFYLPRNRKKETTQTLGLSMILPKLENPNASQLFEILIGVEAQSKKN